MLFRSLGRRLVHDARLRTPDNTSAAALLNALTRHHLPIPSPTPSTTPTFSCRNYATRSTGTQTAKAQSIPRKERKPPATSKSAKPRAKSAASTKKKTKKPAKKPASKKKTAAKKKKPAAKKKPRKKQPLTQFQKQLAKVKQLKGVAMLPEPKKKPTTVWQLIFSESVTGENAEMRVKEKSTKYKSLQGSEREAYQTKAASNAAANTRDFRAWLEKHTPDQVRVANNARIQLSRIAHQPLPAGRKHHLTRSYHRLRDERIGKRPQTPYSLFLAERFATGDFQGVKVLDATKKVALEWKALDDGEKKKYQDIYAASRVTYEARLTELFPTMKRKFKDAATTVSSTAAG